jgi:hypothetical protein
MTCLNTVRKLRRLVLRALSHGGTSLAVIGFCAGLGHAEEWSAQFKIEEFGPQANEVQFEILKIEETQILVKMENVSIYDFKMYGHGDRPTYYLTDGDGDQEKLVDWDWCGTGKVDMLLCPQWQKLIAIPRPRSEKATKVYLRIEKLSNRRASMLLVYQEPREAADK